MEEARAEAAVAAAPTLPREVLHLVVAFAVTARGGTFVMPCLTGMGFRPNVNLACLVLE